MVDRFSKNLTTIETITVGDIVSISIPTKPVALHMQREFMSEPFVLFVVTIMESNALMVSKLIDITQLASLSVHHHHKLLRLKLIFPKARSNFQTVDSHTKQGL